MVICKKLKSIENTIFNVIHILELYISHDYFMSINNKNVTWFYMFPFLRQFCTSSHVVRYSLKKK